MADLNFHNQALMEAFVEWLFKDAKTPHEAVSRMKAVLMNVERILPDHLFGVLVADLHQLTGAYLKDRAKHGHKS